MSSVRSWFVLASSFVVGSIALAAPRQDPVAPAPAAKQEDLERAMAELEGMINDGDVKGAEARARALIAANPQLHEAYFFLGYSLHAQGKIDEALPAHLEATKARTPGTAAIAHYNAGCAYALKGDKDNALAQLELAVDKKVSQLAQFDKDPDLKSLVGDPRFDALLVKRRGGATKRPAAAATYETIAYSGERKGSRIIWLPTPLAPAKQMHVDWSPVAWNDAMEKRIESGELDGQRWRFGKDFWTTFDTNADVRVGDVAIPAGAWFLTLVARGGKVFLQFNDPAVARKSGLDPFVADKLPPPAHEVELKVVRAETVTPTLTLELLEGAKPHEATFAVAFGKYRLSTPIVAVAN